MGMADTFLRFAGKQRLCRNPLKTAVQAMHCQPASTENGFNGNCPYPTDLYRSDPRYKKDITTSLKEARLAGLLGENATMTGPESPLEPVTIAGETWLLGSVCETNNCGDHYLNFLYQPAEHRVTGYYFDGQGHWVGQPGAEAIKLLRGSETAAPPLKPVAVSPDAPPPNTIWTFTGEGVRHFGRPAAGKPAVAQSLPTRSITWRY